MSSPLPPAVIDNFSRRILSWRVGSEFQPGKSVTVLLDASRAAAPSDTAAGLYGAEVLELHDRSVVALTETSVALPPLAGQCHHRSSPGRRSTSMNTTVCFRIRRLADRRLTRCIS